MIIEKHCLKRIYGTGLADTVFSISLINSDKGPSCIICNEDDWEVSYTKEDAEYKFMLLLEDEYLLHSSIIHLGFDQYG